MKYYTMGFSLLLFSFVAILILLYFGGLTRQIEKDIIIIIRSEINKLNDKIQINELEYVAHTSPSYLKKLEQLYLINQYDKNVNLNIVSIQDFKAKSIHKVFKVKK